MLSRALSLNFTFRFELYGLTFLFIELELELVNSSVQLLQLLSAQELFFLIRNASQTINLLCLNLSKVHHSLIFTQKHVNLLLVLSILIGNICALLLCLNELVLDFLDSFFIAVTNRLQFLLMASLHLVAQTHARL